MNFTQTYFQIFDLPEAYALNLERLKKNYRAIQSKLHPDRFAKALDREKRLAEQYSAFINEGYQTLKHPTKRALYILKLKGCELEIESTFQQDPEFLMQQIELNDSLDAIAEAPQTQEQNATEFCHKLQAERDELIEQFAIYTLQKETLPQAVLLVRKMQFLDKLYSRALAVAKAN